MYFVNLAPAVQIFRYSALTLIFERLYEDFDVNFHITVLLREIETHGATKLLQYKSYLIIYKILFQSGFMIKDDTLSLFSKIKHIKFRYVYLENPE